LSESTIASEFNRWMQKRSISAQTYEFLASVPGSMLVNTPIFRLDKNLVLKPGQRLLDVGCGRASLLQVLASRLPFENPPVGIDVSVEMLRRGLAGARSDQAAIALLEATGTRMPFQPDSFDIATCGYVLKHLDDAGLTRLLHELLRVLKPGGFALMWEFSPTRSVRLNSWHRWLLTRGVSACNLRAFSELAAAATGAGFEWVENAHLRPFLFPPIPRVSLVAGKAPEGWRERTGPGRARRAAMRLGPEI
jgi:SAM-dependent methyltransferase